VRTERDRVLPVVLAGFSAFLGLYATQPLLPLLARVFHASRFAASLTITAPALGVAIAAPIAGHLGDRFRRRRVIVVAAFAMAVTTALAATSRTLVALIVWRFLQGLVTPGVFSVTIAYVHDQWPSGQAGATTSAYVTGTIIGGFSGRVLSGVVASAFSWQAAFVMLAALDSVAWLILYVRLPQDHQPPHLMTPPHAQVRWRRLTGPDLLATYVVGFGILFTIVATFTYVTFHLAAPPYALSTAALGWLFAVYLAGAAMTTLVSRWFDQFEHRTWLARGVALGIAGTLITLGHSVALVVAGLAVFCAGIFLVQTTATSHVGASPQPDRGAAVGLYATLYYTGGSAGAVAPAFVWDLGGWPACVALLAIVQVAVAIVGLVWWTDASHLQAAVPHELG
jgi:YNFM family putative membrane transporter